MTQNTALNTSKKTKNKTVLLSLIKPTFKQLPCFSIGLFLGLTTLTMTAQADMAAGEENRSQPSTVDISAPIAA